jgi:Co/Zn/Cd efflux system component
MAGCCDHNHACATAHSDAAWRRVLWVALAINGAMFVAEIVAGVAAGSASLQADALDFLGDSVNYAISLGVAGMTLAWRSRAALAKGASLLALGLWVLLVTSAHVFASTFPEAHVMGAVGLVAMAANGGVALMLYRYRSGDANMRSVWICSRNDVIGNAAVLLAALGVFGTGTGWPDVVVAAVMAALGLSGGWQIIRHALAEMRGSAAASQGAAAPLTLR